MWCNRDKVKYFVRIPYTEKLTKTNVELILSSAIGVKDAY